MRRWRFVIWLSAVAACLGIIATLGIGKDTEALIADLHAPTAETRYSATLMLGDRGAEASRAIPALAALLGDREQVIRRTQTAGDKLSRYVGHSVGAGAAEALARIGPASVPALIETLRTGSSESRHNALHALSRISGIANPEPLPAFWEKWWAENRQRIDR